MISQRKELHVDADGQLGEPPHAYQQANGCPLDLTGAPRSPSKTTAAHTRGMEEWMGCVRRGLCGTSCTYRTCRFSLFFSIAGMYHVLESRCALHNNFPFVPSTSLDGRPDPRSRGGVMEEQAELELHPSDAWQDIAPCQQDEVEPGQMAFRCLCNSSSIACS